MSQDSSSGGPPPPVRSGDVLDRAASAGLVLVLLSLVWVVVAAEQPGWAAWPDLEVQVLVLLGLLTTALLLVSAVALRHTR